MRIIIIFADFFLNVDSYNWKERTMYKMYIYRYKNIYGAFTSDFGWNFVFKHN